MASYQVEVTAEAHNYLRHAPGYLYARMMRVALFHSCRTRIYGMNGSEGFPRIGLIR